MESHETPPCGIQEPRHALRRSQQVRVQICPLPVCSTPRAPLPTPVDPGEAARIALTQEAIDARADSKTVSDKIRGRAEASGQGLITLGTALVGYLGLTRATDVFPIPPGWGWLSVLAFVLLALMLASAVAMGRRLSRASEPVVMTLDPAKNAELSKRERAAVNDVYERYTGNEQPSLVSIDDVRKNIVAAYETYKPGTPLPEEPFSRAAQLRAELKCTQQRAVTKVIRLRVRNATTGPFSILIIAVFVLSAVGFGIATEKIAVERTTTTTTLSTIKQCGEAAAAKTADASITVKLPTDCTR
jgi:hypothetical protein